MSEVYRFEKNSRETIVASLTTFQGYPIAGIPIYVENGEGEEVPTKKGISVRPEQLPQLLEAVQALVEASAVKVA
jgi:hypothetical protein